MAKNDYLELNDYIAELSSLVDSIINMGYLNNYDGLRYMPSSITDAKNVVDDIINRFKNSTSIKDIVSVIINNPIDEKGLDNLIKAFINYKLYGEVNNSYLLFNEALKTEKTGDERKKALQEIRERNKKVEKIFKDMLKNNGILTINKEIYYCENRPKKRSKTKAEQQSILLKYPKLKDQMIKDLAFVTKYFRTVLSDQNLQNLQYQKQRKEAIKFLDTEIEQIKEKWPDLLSSYTQGIKEKFENRIKRIKELFGIDKKDINKSSVSSLLWATIYYPPNGVAVFLARLIIMYEIGKSLALNPNESTLRYTINQKDKTELLQKLKDLERDLKEYKEQSSAIEVRTVKDIDQLNQEKQELETLKQLKINNKNIIRYIIKYLSPHYNKFLTNPIDPLEYNSIDINKLNKALDQLKNQDVESAKKLINENSIFTSMLSEMDKILSDNNIKKYEVYLDMFEELVNLIKTLKDNKISYDVIREIIDNKGNIRLNELIDTKLQQIEQDIEETAGEKFEKSKKERTHNIAESFKTTLETFKKHYDDIMQYVNNKYKRLMFMGNDKKSTNIMEKLNKYYKDFKKTYDHLIKLQDIDDQDVNIIKSITQSLEQYITDNYKHQIIDDIQREYNKRYSRTITNELATISNLGYKPAQLEEPEIKTVSDWAEWEEKIDFVNKYSAPIYSNIARQSAELYSNEMEGLKQFEHINKEASEIIYYDLRDYIPDPEVKEYIINRLGDTIITNSIDIVANYKANKNSIDIITPKLLHIVMHKKDLSVMINRDLVEQLDDLEKYIQNLNMTQRIAAARFILKDINSLRSLNNELTQYLKDNIDSIDNNYLDTIKNRINEHIISLTSINLLKAFNNENQLATIKAYINLIIKQLQNLLIKIEKLKNNDIDIIENEKIRSIVENIRFVDEMYKKYQTISKEDKQDVNKLVKALGGQNNIKKLADILQEYNKQLHGMELFYKSLEYIILITHNKDIKSILKNAIEKTINDTDKTIQYDINDKEVQILGILGEYKFIDIMKALNEIINTAKYADSESIKSADSKELIYHIIIDLEKIVKDYEILKDKFQKIQKSTEPGEKFELQAFESKIIKNNLSKMGKQLQKIDQDINLSEVFLDMSIGTLTVDKFYDRVATLYRSVFEDIEYVNIEDGTPLLLEFVLNKKYERYVHILNNYIKALNRGVLRRESVIPIPNAEEVGEQKTIEALIKLLEFIPNQYKIFKTSPSKLRKYLKDWEKYNQIFDNYITSLQSFLEEPIDIKLLNIYLDGVCNDKDEYGRLYFIYIKDIIKTQFKYLVNPVMPYINQSSKYDLLNTLPSITKNVIEKSDINTKYNDNKLYKEALKNIISNMIIYVILDTKEAYEESTENILLSYFAEMIATIFYNYTKSSDKNTIVDRLLQLQQLGYSDGCPKNFTGSFKRGNPSAAKFFNTYISSCFKEFAHESNKQQYSEEKYNQTKKDIKQFCGEQIK